MSTFKLGPIQEKWIKSLEDHPEKQLMDTLGKKHLNSEGYKACCLGEGGLIAGVCNWEGNVLIVSHKDNYGTIQTDMNLLRFDIHLALGLRSKNGEADGFTSLAGMNDTGKTWPEIAAILRTNPERYFTKSI